MSIFGERGVLRVDGGLAQCHVCGRFYGHLGGHIIRRHGIEADEYREMFGLNRHTGLIGPALAEKRRAQTQQLTPLPGSSPETNTARGTKRPWRQQGKINQSEAQRRRMSAVPPHERSALAGKASAARWRRRRSEAQNLSGENR